MLQTLEATGRTVIWLGLAAVQGRTDNEAIAQINAVDKDVVARHPNVVYVDDYELFLDADGKYAAKLPDETGNLVLVRTGDGVHLTEDGAERLARAVYKLVDAQCKTGPEEGGRDQGGDPDGGQHAGRARQHQPFRRDGLDPPARDRHHRYADNDTRHPRPHRRPPPARDDRAAGHDDPATSDDAAALTKPSSPDVSASAPGHLGRLRPCPTSSLPPRQPSTAPPRSSTSATSTLAHASTVDGRISVDEARRAPGARVRPRARGRARSKGAG